MQTKHVALFITAAISVPFTLAVNVGFGSADDCSDISVACDDINVQLCCANPLAMFYDHVQFTDYPSNPLILLQAFEEGSNNEDCGTNCATGFGTDSKVCLSCDDAGVLGGAAFFDLNAINGRSRMRRQDSDAGCTKPNRAKVGGRWFNINYDVPAADTEALLELLAARVSGDQVPKHLLQYQIG